MNQNKPVFARPDTMLGVCEALGQDFGFNANILRVALAVAMLWNPLAVIGTYLALGAAVLVSRLFFPAPPAAAEAPDAAAATAPQAENDAVDLPMAA